MRTQFLEFLRGGTLHANGEVHEGGTQRRKLHACEESVLASFKNIVFDAFAVRQ
jgi:hypothetical protein